MDTMDYGQQIESLDQELAASERAVETSRVLREKREQLCRAKVADREARQRAAEAQAALRALREAEADARQAEAAPLHAALGGFDAPLREIEVEITCYLRGAVEDARHLYGRYVELLARRNEVGRRLIALGEPGNHAPVPTFEAFVRNSLRRFDASGRTARGAAWAEEG